MFTWLWYITWCSRWNSIRDSTYLEVSNFKHKNQLGEFEFIFSKIATRKNSKLWLKSESGLPRFLPELDLTTTHGSILSRKTLERMLYQKRTWWIRLILSCFLSELSLSRKFVRSVKKKWFVMAWLILILFHQIAVAMADADISIMIRLGITFSV